MVTDPAPFEADAKEDKGSGWRLQADELGHESLGAVQLFSEFTGHKRGGPKAAPRRAKHSFRALGWCPRAGRDVLALRGVRLAACVVHSWSRKVAMSKGLVVAQLALILLRCPAEAKGEEKWAEGAALLYSLLLRIVVGHSTWLNRAQPDGPQEAGRRSG